MKRNEFEKKHGYITNNYINPLEEHENYYFNLKVYEKDFDYRNLALNKCLDNKESFISTVNNIWNIIRKYLKIKCPKCGNILNFSFTTGGRNEYSSIAECENCKIEISIDLKDDSIGVEFK